MLEEMQGVPDDAAVTLFLLPALLPQRFLCSLFTLDGILQAVGFDIVAAFQCLVNA
jgi:hypothetical protein